GMDLLGRGGGVAECDDHALAAEGGNVIDSAGPLGAQRDETDKPFGGFLPAAELGKLGSADMLERVSTARAVIAAYRRPLDMDERHHGADERRQAAGFGDGRHGGAEGRLGGGDKRGGKAADTGADETP